MSDLTRRNALTLMGGAVLTTPFIRTARANTALNIYNWASYIGETTIEDFQRATGVEITYDTYSSSEEMMSKILAGSSGYDVVLESKTDIGTLAAANVIVALDRAKLPNWNNLDSTILKLLADADPANKFAMPYMWGSVGLAFNRQMVDQRLPGADLDSLDILMKPEYSDKLADCGIAVLDSPMDVFAMVLYYMGKDPATATEADFKAAADLFKPIRKNIKTFDNVNTANAAANKELCVVNVWSGNYATAARTAREAGLDVKLEYHVPKTGVGMWVDCWSITADSKNKDNAYKFLNYLMEPEVIAKCTNFLNYANANTAATPLVDKAITSNPAIYPDAEVMKRMRLVPWTDKQKRLMTRVWSDVKAG